MLTTVFFLNLAHWRFFLANVSMPSISSKSLNSLRVSISNFCAVSCLFLIVGLTFSAQGSCSSRSNFIRSRTKFESLEKRETLKNSPEIPFKECCSDRVHFLREAMPMKSPGRRSLTLNGCVPRKESYRVICCPWPSVLGS